MTNHRPDSALDARLREVNLPEGLLQRLRAQGERRLDRWPDERLDNELRDVAPPASLAVRLGEIPLDEPLDDALCDVRLPWLLLARLHCMATVQPRLHIGRLAIAASLFLMLSCGYLAAVGGLFAHLRGSTRSSQEAIEIVYNGPFELHSPRAAELEQPTFVFEPSQPPAELPDAALAIDLLQDIPHACGAAGELALEINEGIDLWENVFRLRYGVIGAPDRVADNLPVLEAPPLLPRGGIQAPLLRQYNRRFLLQHGVHPPVFPHQHASLRSTRIPLATETSSYNLVKRLLADERLPDPSAVHVEDFLAAIRVFPRLPAPGQVELSVSAGPSYFGQRMAPAVRRELEWNPGPAELIHVCAQAGIAKSDKRGAHHVTVLLDASASMRWANRLETSKQALRQLLAQLAPQDRLSLVAFNEEIVHFNAFGHQDAETAWEALDRVKAQGGTNLAGALQQGLEVAMGGPRSDAGVVRHLVLLTDGRARISEMANRQIQEMLADAVGQSLRFSVLELNEAGLPDPVLAGLARAAGGDVRQLMSEQKLSWSLLELLAGDASLVAQDAVLTVTFRPQVVAAYRLYGHEATGLAGLMPVAVESDLRAGQSAGALFEVWLRPGSDDDVGRATLEWFDREAGSRRRVTRRISRLQMAPSFVEASLPLQAATIAAETAEVLRESPFVNPRDGRLAAVLDLAGDVSPSLAEKASFQQFISFIEDVREVSVRRGGD